MLNSEADSSSTATGWAYRPRRKTDIAQTLTSTSSRVASEKYRQGN